MEPRSGGRHANPSHLIAESSFISTEVAMEPRSGGRQANPSSPRSSGTMRPPDFGIEAVVDADRAYSGSRFREVRDAVFSEPYSGIWDGDGRMPTYQVTLKSVLR